MIDPATLPTLVIDEIARIAGWCVGRLDAGDVRKGTQRDLGGLLALEAAVRAFAASRGVGVPSLQLNLVPERMRRLALVAEAALDTPHEIVARSMTLAASVSFDSLLGLSDPQAGRVLALAVVKSSFHMSAAGQKALFGAATNEAKRLRVETDTAISVLSRVAVTSAATGRDREVFIYSGPIDGRLGPFCLERVGRVFSRRAIDAMKNGQLDNVFLTAAVTSAGLHGFPSRTVMSWSDWRTRERSSVRATRRTWRGRPKRERD